MRIGLIFAGLAALWHPATALNPDRPADSYSIHGWFTENGLPSNKVRALAQSRQGYLWVATARGVARFDGSDFTTYTAENMPELRGGGFFAVVEAADGSVWWAGDHGLFRWHQGQLQRFTTDHGLPDNYVRTLGAMKDGAVVVGTRAGFSLAKEGRLITPTGEWRLITGMARSSLERANGDLLLGTEEDLWSVRGGKVERLSGRGRIEGRLFNNLIETPDGSLWIGYSAGLLRLRPDGSRENFGVAEGLSHPTILALEADLDGNLWVGTAHGLDRFRHGRFERAHYPAQIGGASLQQLRRDREGGLWIAGSTGLFRLKDNVSTCIGYSEGLMTTSVYTVTEARDGQWWIGTWGGGVYRYTGGRATPLPVSSAHNLSNVLATAESPGGQMWFGASFGLYQLLDDGQLVNHFQGERMEEWRQMLKTDPAVVLPGLAHRRINALAFDERGALWAATDGALYHGAPGEFRAYTTLAGMPATKVAALLRTRSGDLWATLPPHGVARLRAGEWTVFRCGQELSPLTPRAVYEDDVGAIWVTTEGGGLNRFQHARWRVFTTVDGLAADFISAVVDDGLGNLWIASPPGVMRIPRRDFDEVASGERATLQPRMFNRFDGLPAGETNFQGYPNAWRTRDGRVLIGTDRGVAVIEPQQVNNEGVLPPLQIERITADGTTFDLARPIVVPPGTNDLRLHYTAISLLAPEKVRFKIRLEPLDESWLDVESRRDVRYSKLPAGDYTFHLITTDQNGEWANKGTSVGFTVRPFFHETRWFIALLLGGTAGFVTSAVWLRGRLVKRNLRKLEKLVEVRTEQLQSAKEDAENAVQAKEVFIAALKEAQAEIAHERERLKFIFEAVPVGIALAVPGDRTPRLVNPAYERMTGLSATDQQCPGAMADITHPDDRRLLEQFERRYARGEIDHFTVEQRYLHADGRIVWVALTRRLFTEAESGQKQSVTTLVDITERKQSEVDLAETHEKLIAASRQAGMAEVATGVLHNVGNVLNSVNVSATLLSQRVRESKIARVTKLHDLVAAQSDLAAFFAHDPRGRRIPGYLRTLGTHLIAEQATLLNELQSLRKHIEHIKDVVAMQQNYAKVSGVCETVAVTELVEDALSMNAGSLERNEIMLAREFESRPTLTTDKHKVLQILVNLLRNAKYACEESGRDDKRLTIRVTGSDGRVRISVADNGVGIPAENLTRIFGHGFTTRKNGHGFGLHSGALAARQLGGSLTAHSDGPGRGAVFTLDLPEHPEANEG